MASENEVACFSLIEAEFGETIEDENMFETLPEGVKLDKKTCEHCFKVLSSYSNKKKHVERYHKVQSGLQLKKKAEPNATGLTPDKYTCLYCYKRFVNLGNKSRHLRKCHNIENQKNGQITKCLECDIRFKTIQKLRDHLQDIHNLNMELEEYTFPNINAFKQWKNDIERQELVSFTVCRGARQTLRGQKTSYECHRSGKFSNRTKEPCRKRMVKTQGTCKLGIMCTSTITCLEDVNKVSAIYCPHHYGHGKAASSVQLSTADQNEIQENISRGEPCEPLLYDVQYGSSEDPHQTWLLKHKDVKFITKALNAEEYNSGLSDAESVDRWVQLCCQMEDSPILYYNQIENLDDENFVLIIMTETQKHILAASDKQVICLDSLSQRKGGRFYLTCLFVMDENEVAFPVAFCISDKVNKAVLKQFLFSIRESTGPLSCSYFMSDCEKLYYEAWQEVMGEEPKWIWSKWYIDKRFKSQLYVFKGNVTKRAEVYKTFRMLLECQHPNIFETMLKNYIESLLSDPQSKNLVSLLMKKYKPHTENWANCYEKDIKLSNIVCLEGLFRTLRYCCREGRKKRLDKFIFVIMKFVRYKMLQRLTNTLDSEKILLAINVINECHKIGLEIPGDRISSLSDKIWLVDSCDEEEERVYVTRDFESCPELCRLRCSECDICVHMFSCSCLHSLINANFCQHIHAVVWKFLTPHFSPIHSPTYENCEEIENIDVSMTQSSSPSELLDNVLRRTHDVYKKVRSKRNAISQESLNAVMQHLNHCINICSDEILEDSQAEDSNKKESVVSETNKPYKEMKDSSSQTLLSPNLLQAENKSYSQYILLLPNKCIKDPSILK